MSYPPLSDRFMLKPRLKIMVDILFVITNIQKSQKKDDGRTTTEFLSWYFYFSPRESEEVFSAGACDLSNPS